MRTSLLVRFGRGAPQISTNDPPTYSLPDAEFLEELKRINGTPRETFENAELMRLMLPILRADFQICQTHRYTEEPPLSCPIIGFGGLCDEVTCEDMEAWRVQTTKCLSLHMLPGDHFFVRTHEDIIVKIVGSWLNRI